MCRASSRTFCRNHLKSGPVPGEIPLLLNLPLQAPLLFASCRRAGYNGRPSPLRKLTPEREEESLMEKQMIISVMSKDRPGIIADVTGAIFELNGDLADINQSVLCGYLTMILIATFANGVTPEDVVAKLSHVKSEIKFDVIVKAMDVPVEIAKSSLPKKTYIVTAQGKNKSGLVYGISSFCYQRNINILDLSTTLIDDRYTMILQLDLTNIASIKDIRRDLDRYAEETGLHVMMQHYDIFRVTHEVTLT
jgi:glycine cleavage system transcriptional repressor